MDNELLARMDLITAVEALGRGQQQHPNPLTQKWGDTFVALGRWVRMLDERSEQTWAELTDAEVDRIATAVVAKLMGSVPVDGEHEPVPPIDPDEWGLPMDGDNGGDLPPDSFGGDSTHTFPPIPGGD